jgi:hypothetical protein
LAGLATLASPAGAEVQYPWCIQYGGGRNGIGATSCGFVSQEQCLASRSGLGAMCMPNPAYSNIARPAKIRHRHRQHSD